jgi:hypothetical protein
MWSSATPNFVTLWHNADTSDKRQKSRRNVGVERLGTLSKFVNCGHSNTAADGIKKPSNKAAAGQEQ